MTAPDDNSPEASGERLLPGILTASGTWLDLWTLPADAIRIEDIAHHLAQLNRYTGAARRPYSVAEHSLGVVELMRHAGVIDPSALLAGLMHDAHEAYTADLSSPMKLVIGDAWVRQERRIQRAVLGRFGLITATAAWGFTIGNADMTALLTEREQLLPPGGPEWVGAGTYPLARWWRIADSDGMDWTDWRTAFQDTFEELDDARRARRAIATEVAR